MHPHTDELLRHLDANRVVLRAAVDTVPAHLRESRPTADRWSVAEVLEHLTRVEEQITRVLAVKLSEARAAGLLHSQSETSPIGGALNHQAVLDRRRPVTAGERVLPRGDMNASAALTALDATRAKLRELVASVDGLALETFTLPHPALGVINGYQWFLFVGSHEARHAAQIREIGTVLGDDRS
jgi:hypothetical protein